MKMKKIIGTYFLFAFRGNILRYRQLKQKSKKLGYILLKYFRFFWAVVKQRDDCIKTLNKN